MANHKYNLHKYPAPCLKVKCKDFPSPLDAAHRKLLSELVKGMLQVMYNHRGAGLAANQVGSKWRVMVLNPESDIKNGPQFETVIINPKLEPIATGAAVLLKDEGCLSLPGVWWKRERPDKINVSGLDRYGKPLEKTLTGLAAQAFLHCLELLNGEIWVQQGDKLIDINAPAAPYMGSIEPLKG